MPEGVVDRALAYVGLLFLFTLASTFPWWAGAQLARVEYKSLMSALACAMRIFFYSVCLLCILVALRAFNLSPRDPRSTLFGWIHIGGTVGITIPSAWRAFRDRGPRLLAVLAIGWTLCLTITWLAMNLSDGFRAVVLNLPRYLSRG